MTRSRLQERPQRNCTASFLSREKKGEKIGDFDVKYHTKIKSKNAVLLVGLPGVGLVGQIVANYLISNTKSRLVATIRSDSFLPRVLTSQEGTIHSLKDEVYYIKRPKRDIFVLVGEAQPGLSPQGGFSPQHAFAREIAKMAKQLGCSEVYTLAGMGGTSRLTDGSKVTVVATHPEVFSSIKGRWKRHPTNFAIDGAAGLILQYTMDCGMKGACLIGATTPHVKYPDMSAAKLVLEVVKSTLNIKLDMKNMAKQAEQFEKQLKATVAAGVEETKTPSDTFRERYPSYIR